jgi:hypothetical protein
MADLVYASQNFSTTLNVAGGIDDSETAGIVLTSVSGLDTNGGILCFDWANPLDTDTAEYVEYGGISGNTLTGVTRGVEGLSAKAHSNGATVVAVLSADHINRINDKLTGADTDGVTLANVEFTTNDPNLATGLNIQVNSVDPWRTITLTPGLLKPTTTSGCAATATVEAGTNDIDYDVLDFDKSSDENAFANFQMPDSWDGGVIQFRYIWTSAGGSAAETVVFELSGRSFANDDAIDQAVGTPVEVSDALIATGDVHVSSWSGDVTITGAGAGEWVHLEIMRDVSEDNLDSDARLIGVQIRYRQGQYSD